MSEAARRAAEAAYMRREIHAHGLVRTLLESYSNEGDAMNRQSVPSLNTTPARVVRYAFPLRQLPGGHVQNAYVEMPTDFTPAEAERVAVLVKALADGLSCGGGAAREVCPGDPGHYAEAHSPGGAWFGVPLDHYLGTSAASEEKP